jgi:hypothetical protein
MGTPYANEIRKNAIFGCFLETYTFISQILLPKYFRLKPKHPCMAPRKLSSIAHARMFRFKLHKFATPGGINQRKTQNSRLHVSLSPSSCHEKV